MGTDKQSVGILDTINMETVRTMLTHTYPYPHEHSRHAIIAVYSMDISGGFIPSSKLSVDGLFLGLWYIGVVSRMAGRRPNILTVLQNC
ncbi:hypothetical protein M8C21_020664, partial [Ambrosia artemisiifolia]